MTVGGAGPPAIHAAPVCTQPPGRLRAHLQGSSLSILPRHSLSVPFPSWETFHDNPLIPADLVPAPLPGFRLRPQPAKPALTSPSPVWLASPETPQLLCVRHPSPPTTALSLGVATALCRTTSTQSDLLQGSESLCPWPPLSPHLPGSPEPEMPAEVDGRQELPGVPTGARTPGLSTTPGSSSSPSTHAPQARVLLLHVTIPQGQSCRHHLPQEQAHLTGHVWVGSEHSPAGGVAQSSWEHLDDRGAVRRAKCPVKMARQQSCSRQGLETSNLPAKTPHEYLTAVNI